MIERREGAVIRWDPGGLPDLKLFVPYTRLVHALPLGPGEKQRFYEK